MLHADLGAQQLQEPLAAAAAPLAFNDPKEAFKVLQACGAPVLAEHWGWPAFR